MQAHVLHLLLYDFMISTAKMSIVFETAKQKRRFFYFSASIGLE